jgi:uncharacterized membrane protein
MCLPAIPLAIAGAGLLGAGMSYVNGKKANKAAKAQMAQNESLAAAEAQRAEQQFNRQNQKQPDIVQMFQNNQRAANKGLGSTFLTGTKGVPNSMLQLGGGPSLLGA